MNTHRNSRSDNEGIISETMETKDPAINQHQTDSSGDRYNTDHNFDDRESDKEENSDPYFQKNSDIAQDLDEDLKKDNDPDRRTLDEYKTYQAEPEEDEEE